MELALPITVYWDLAPRLTQDNSLLRICDEILKCRPLMLQLYDPSNTLSEGGCAILERFRGTPVAVSLTMPYSSELFLAGITNDELGVKELLLSCDSFESLVNLPSLSHVGLSFSVTRNNWHELPDVVTFCRNRGLNRLVLPMQRLYGEETSFLLNKSDQGILREALAAIGGTADLRLTIHDPFLWRAFNPGVPFPQGGCQAANTMIAISADGGVYPCPTLPVRLGELCVESLRDVLTSQRKKDFRRSLLSNPTACRDCFEVAECKGGCRGRAYVMHNSLDGMDESCC